MDNQDSTNNPMCTVCNGFGIPLGTLGNVVAGVMHYRCRNCGVDFSTPLQDSEGMCVQTKYKYIVWVGGVDDYYTSYDEALEHYDEWIEQGYEEVQIEEICNPLPRGDMQ
jgi:hypothetical protein